ncbi:MAG TPA: CPBP family intramembrane glutamic endopeptidase [Puia sp.]|jgi:membrane protease YdiL (CAAX protease family)|nr:CPBP family intramembrane glutamic endopeptidase [Puia sp.]
MNKKNIFNKILFFFLTKIIIGIAAIAGAVILIESAFRPLLEKIKISDEIINGIVGISEALAALLIYIFLFSFYEKRKITELSSSTFGSNANFGFFTGFLLQSSFILIIFIAGDYTIVRVNAFSDMIPAFIMALTAGFVAEIIIIGIVFRLIEKQFGTAVSITIMIIIFVIAHSGVKDGNLISVLSTSINAGLLLPAAYVFSRSLWLPIFMHFAWDFTEPGIYGAINPGISITKSLFDSKISGPRLITGGPLGPQNSIQALIICLVLGIIFLRLAKMKGNVIPFKLRLS